MRRIVAGVLVLLPAGAGGAIAQSVSALPGSPSSASPSIIQLGAPEASVEARPLRRGEGAEAEIFSVSRSVVAYGIDAIAPARSEKVAALPAPEATEPTPAQTAPAWSAETMPLIIRGGIAGDAFSSSPAPTIDLSRDEAPAAPDGEPL